MATDVLERKPGQLLTFSRQDAFKTCRKKAWFSYEQAMGAHIPRKARTLAPDNEDRGANGELQTRKSQHEGGREMIVKEGTTYRGFGLVEFLDSYGHRCTLQKSSLATDDAIWLGVEDAEPKILASQAAAYGVKTDETTGWIPYPVPDDVLMTTRMHLTRENVRELLPYLRRFLDTGDFQAETGTRDDLTAGARAKEQGCRAGHEMDEGHLDFAGLLFGLADLAGNDLVGFGEFFLAKLVEGLVDDVGRGEAEARPGRRIKEV